MSHPPPQAQTRDQLVNATHYILPPKHGNILCMHRLNEAKARHHNSKQQYQQNNTGNITKQRTLVLCCWKVVEQNNKLNMTNLCTDFVCTTITKQTPKKKNEIGSAGDMLRCYHMPEKKKVQHDNIPGCTLCDVQEITASIQIIKA